ncbi:uncharacterized protein LOC133038001 [Cannabis sativa]|uniref:uncharacterized protein LOC133038001 n=1 Tax=Cannabis sativa TaxID=3483 RepID=UPI0029CA1F31|nr:uncharacterized protein LOC133038001 [Cannabis sativa]
MPRSWLWESFCIFHQGYVSMSNPTKAYYWIEAEIILKNINQDFYYMSCDFCNKKLMFYNDNEETDCENPKCGKRCLPTPRARTYVTRRWYRVARCCDVRSCCRKHILMYCSSIKIIFGLET